jgi:hypothetical protein
VPDAHATADFRGQLHSRASRALAAALVLVGWTGLVTTALAGAFGLGDLLLPAGLFPTVLAFAVAPAIAAWLVERSAAARMAVHEVAVALRRADLHVELARGEITGLVPWTIPLPGPGLSIALRDGRTLSYGFEIADPAGPLTVLGPATAMSHPVVVWAHARATQSPWRWHHLLWKFVGFALAPAIVLFNAHQHIAYGGTLGQYYFEGLGPYLRTFAVIWATTSIYLVLWAGVWRALGEGVALLAAVVAPSRAARVRRTVEIACRVLYYAGAPALLAVRFFI